MARQTYQKSRDEWKNDEIGDTPVLAENLNHIEDGIKANSENMALKEIYGDDAVSFGRRTSSQIGTNSFAYGNDVVASDAYSNATNMSTVASGQASHAEGAGTTASGFASHSENQANTASGANSHAEGAGTVASGAQSHSEGAGTKASSSNQHVQGKYNIEDTADQYAHIVGNGTSNDNRSNAHTVDWQGNGWFAGDVTDGNGTSISFLLSKIEALEAKIETLSV